MRLLRRVIIETIVEEEYDAPQRRPLICIDRESSQGFINQRLNEAYATGARVVFVEGLGRPR